MIDIPKKQKGYFIRWRLQFVQSICVKNYQVR